MTNAVSDYPALRFLALFDETARCHFCTDAPAVLCVQDAFRSEEPCGSHGCIDHWPHAVVHQLGSRVPANLSCCQAPKKLKSFGGLAVIPVEPPTRVECPWCGNASSFCLRASGRYHGCAVDLSRSHFAARPLVAPDARECRHHLTVGRPYTVVGRVAGALIRRPIFDLGSRADDGALQMVG